MGIDSDSSGPDTGDTADRADRAEQTAGQQPSADDHRPAETLSREEYSDHVRARGSPIGQHDTPPREAAESGEPGTLAGPPEAPVADRLNGRSPGPDLNTGDIASGSTRPEDTGDAPARATADPALAEEHKAVQVRAADTEKRSVAEPSATGEGDSASGQPGTSPDNTRPEPRWDDAGVFRMAGRSMSTWTATATGCTQATVILTGTRQRASSSLAWKMTTHPDPEAAQQIL